MKEYKISVEARILELLGPSLYTNIYYVLGELIANAYDADAKNVYIILTENSLIVEDDGKGMSYKNNEIDQFLKVASESNDREDTALGRKRMGRKGIGKLAALAVSERVIVKTICEEEKSGFILLRAVPENGLLTALDEKEISFERVEKHGTSITMENPQYSLHKTASAIRKRILNLFPDIYSDFKIHLINKMDSNQNFIIDDFSKEKMQELNGLITIGEKFHYLHDYLDSEIQKEELSKKEESYKVCLNEELEALWKEETLTPDGQYKDYYGKELILEGWIGIYKTTRNRSKDMSDFPDNAISIYANNKLGLYNLLPELSRNSINESYIVAQFHVDLFEDKSLPDMSLSNRQGYKTDDIRFRIVASIIRDHYIKQAFKMREYIVKEKNFEQNKFKVEKNLQSEAKLKQTVQNFKSQVSEQLTIQIMEDVKQPDFNPLRLKEYIVRELDDKTEEILNLKKVVDDNKKKILISHTQADKDFANIIYEMLLFNNVPKKDIIYSSSDQTDSKIPFDNDRIHNLYDYLREFFVQTYSKEKIFIIFVTTENTRSSWGTLVELGATWIVQSDHVIYNLNDFDAKEPLNLTEIQNSYFDKENLYHFRAEDDSISFIKHLQKVCDTIGYDMKSAEQNAAHLQQFIKYVSEDRRVTMEGQNKKFMKKPVVIQAYQTSTVEYIETLEGTMKADIGDWIVTGVKGEKYPVKPDIFKETYEEVKE